MTHAVVHTCHPEINEERYDVYVDGQAVGYAATTDRGHDVWVLELTVHPDYRGRGHASALLDAVRVRNAGRVLALSCEPFHCTAWPRTQLNDELSTDALAAWYTRHGFHPDEGTCMIRPRVDTHRPHAPAADITSTTADIDLPPGRPRHSAGELTVQHSVQIRSRNHSNGLRECAGFRGGRSLPITSRTGRSSG
jgi:predicted GNAT family acetyltransferase